MARFADLLLLELRRRLRDPLSLIVWLAIPFFMVAVMVAVFGPKGGGSLPPVKVLLVDHDDGLVSRVLGSALTSEELAQYFDVEAVDERRAAELMDRGAASLLVVIPEGFSRGFFDDEPLTIRAYRNPQESIMPKMGEELIRFLADSGGVLRAALLPLLDGVVDADPATRPSLADTLAVTRRIYETFDRPEARGLASVTALKVTEHHPPRKNATRSEVTGWFAPGFVALALLFTANGQTQDIQEDLVRGRLGRAWTFPSRPSLSLLAKAAALMIAMSATAGILIAAFAAVLGWRPGNLLAVTALVLATAAAFGSLSLLLRSLTRNPEAGGAAASGIMVGLGFLGGCFVPVPFLPSFLRGVADLVPTGWAVQGFNVLQGAAWAGARGGAGWRIAALAATAVVCFAVGSRLMRRKVVLR